MSIPKALLHLRQGSLCERHVQRAAELDEFALERELAVNPGRKLGDELVD